MVKLGLAFHCHHDILYEFVYDYGERVRFIKKNKPKSEQELRLKLFKMIPEDKLPGKDSAEYIAYAKAWVAYDKAREAYAKAREAYAKAREAYAKAWVAYDKAWEAYDKAWEAYDKKYHKELLKLHEELCPGCPWDGKSIFRS